MAVIYLIDEQLDLTDVVRKISKVDNIEIDDELLALILFSCRAADAKRGVALCDECVSERTGLRQLERRSDFLLIIELVVLVYQSALSVVEW